MCSLTVAGLVSTSRMYSATVMGPVAWIFVVRCRSREGRDLLPSSEELQTRLT